MKGGTEDQRLLILREQLFLFSPFYKVCNSLRAHSQVLDNFWQLKVL